MDEDIRVTKHAVDKFMDITQCSDREAAEKRLLRMFEKSFRVEVHPAIAAQRILRNKIRNGSEIKPTDYYEYSSYRFAVVDNTIVTFELMFKKKRGRNGRRKSKR